MTHPRYHLLVIGAGPAGLTAARSAAALGADVALVEHGKLGGDSLNDGCIPSKSLIRTARVLSDMRRAAVFGADAPADVRVNFPLALQRMRRIRARVGRLNTPEQMAREGIHLYTGHARFVACDAVEVNGVQLRFKKALIATGSRSLLPTIPGLAEVGFLTNESVFDLPALPDSMLIVGGGPLGCELAQVFARFGTRTVILHSEPLFLPMEERDAAQMVSDALARDGVEIHLNSTVAQVRADGTRKLVDFVNDGQTATTCVDTILTGIGRLPAVEGLGLDVAGIKFDPQLGIHVDDFLRTTNPHVYAAGDVCLDHAYTNTAEASARIVVRNALFLGRQQMSALTVPWCTYTDPEIAHVGMYVKQARQRRIAVKTFTVPMHDVDRAITDSEEDGFVKIHVREGTDTILGATIVARQAGDMINAVSMAMVAGVGLRGLGDVLHAYPTQGAAIHQAAQAYLRTRLTTRKADAARRWLMR